jgi:hypothetical protein
MHQTKLDLTAIFRRPDTVAALVDASQVFSFLQRSLDLPAPWSALVSGESGARRLVRAGGVVERNGAEELLLVRAAPMELSWSEEDVRTSDGFQCQARLSIRVSPIAEAAEIESFRRAIVGSHRLVTLGDLVVVFAPYVRAALARFCEQQPAERLVDAKAASDAAAAIHEALKPLLFSSGMDLAAAASVAFDSASLRQVRRAEEEARASRRRHESARSVQEAIERSQHEHVAHLTGLLERLRTMAEASPDARVPELMHTFSEQQRGELYQALFAAGRPSRTTLWIAVVAGEELLYYDASTGDGPARRVSITGAAGAVRSIDTLCDEGGTVRLVIGAAHGVYVMSPEGTSPAHTLLVSDAPPVRGGFNAAAIVGDRIVATHSELGICEGWLDGDRPPRMLFPSMTRGARAVRGACAFGGQIYCSIDDRVIRFVAEQGADRPDRIYTGSPSLISAVRPSEEGLFVGTSEGDVLFWSSDRVDRPERLHGGSGRAVESVRIADREGIRRLFYTDTSLYAYARVLGDTFTCRYEAGGQTLRRLDVADDLLVATTDLRDRLLCWRPGEPSRPFATIPVAASTGHTVQDVCLVPGSGTAG